MKIVVVSGEGNSGKSTSIYHFVASRLSNVTYHSNPPSPPSAPNWKSKDFIAIGDAHKGTNIYKVVVCSAGDTVEAIKNAFNFTRTQSPDIAVIASKSYGKTISEIKNQIAILGISYSTELFCTYTYPTPTKPLTFPTPENDRIANNIWSYI